MQVKNFKHRIYIEKGRKTVFAGSIDWPGWVAQGDSESDAIQNLFNIAERYARVMHAAQIDFSTPISHADLEVIETIEGGYATDLGGPRAVPHFDETEMTEKDLSAYQELLMAIWRAFDTAVLSSDGLMLLPANKGGLIDVYAIIGHTIQNDQSDLERLGLTYRLRLHEDPLDELRDIREAMLRAITRVAFNEIPRRELLGEVWTARTFIRKIAWHTLSHAWEIEDRLPENGAVQE